MEKIIEQLDFRMPEGEAEYKSIAEAQRAVFGDDTAFWDDFYIWAGKKCTLAAYDGEKPVGAVNFPEITFPTKESTLYGAYVFGVWVDPAYRKNGIFRELMQRAEKIMRARTYAFAFVVPADEELFAPYKKMGYTLEMENGFPYSAPREILREYNPTDDIYMLWKVYSRVHDMFAKDMEFFNHTLQVMEAEGKCFAISKHGYIVYAPRYDNTVTVYDRMEKGRLVDTGRRAVRGLCKVFCEEAKLQKGVFNMFFEPEYKTITK